MLTVMGASICLPLYTGMYLLSRKVVEVVIYMQVHIDIGDIFIDIKSPFQFTKSSIGARDVFNYVVI